MRQQRNTALIAFGLVCVLLVASIIIQLKINNDNRQATYDVRESQYRACVVNGNTLRDQVRREFVDLKRRVLIPTFAQVAATIPPGQVSRMILTDEVAYMKKRIKTIKERLPDVDCLATYPPINGQTYPKIRPPVNELSRQHP